MKASYRFLLLFSALLLVAGSLMAQGTTGALNGTVVHEGTALPGVTITITSPAMQGPRVAVSNVNGDYNFPAIPPGQYLVQFEMEGMATVTKSVKVGLARTERVNAELQLSAMAAEITVTAAAPAVLETTEVQSNFESELVQNLPTHRNFQSIAMLAPGVTNNSGLEPGQTGEGDPSARTAIVISGAYAYDSLYLIDGSVTSEVLRGQSEDLFIEDAIQETTVMTGSISAEYGRFTGGVVSAITKSGGNEFSGSVRDSFSDPSWTSVSAAGEAKAASSLNETYEATFGGRIVRDRLWFFTAGRYVELTRQRFFTNSDQERPSSVDTDERYEVKLTGQINPKHNLTGSYLSQDVEEVNYCGWGCWDIGAVDAVRQTPYEYVTANYNGILTGNFLLEAGYSTYNMAFENSGGEHITTDYTDPRDIALGSWGYDMFSGGMWGSAVFCGSCDPETRENEYYNLKGTYFLATPGLGTHSVVAGYENFAESRNSNNYQGGSGLDIYVYNGIEPTRATSNHTDPNALRPVIAAGDLLLWTPVENVSLGSDFATESLFVNDKWDLNSNWSFNIGVRYDRNDGKDSSNNPISKDSNVSPRLGAIYDIHGDGRFRVNASYSRYVSRINDGVAGQGGGGNVSYYEYDYDGPTIGGPDSGLASFDVLEQVWTWLLAQGWTPDNPTGIAQFVGARVPGFNEYVPDNMRSPAVDELTIGFGTQLGQKGFARVDFIDRDWTDFYTRSSAPGQTVTGPPGTLDLLTYGNCSDCETRTYQAAILQASYRFTDRLQIGGNYTWSETRGTFEGQDSGRGPLASELEYPEYHDDSWNRPEGFLSSDSTHKARIWLGYDIPLGAYGLVNVSLLERFDSGRPYSAQRIITTRDYVDCHPCGFEAPDTSWTYFFSDRGAYRWDDVSATDVAINYEVPVWKISLFLQGEIINLFDEQAQTNGNTSVSNLEPFDPFNETPVEGVNWEKSSSFGEARGPGDYQLPRTYRLSFGLRF